ncbi:hypothetical protein IX329_001582 [Fusobacterium necrophorum]|nr:SIR2 family protein [Fusobacterium necrophorum]MBR8733976.1 hypothetical protein [Fusobacterium necrophorum]MBR8790152.1 hypothetical protein [Fusobacterium necrophorum]MBR8823165.1 hypothetical protein [Fusobacterium necrophorum]
MNKKKFLSNVIKSLNKQPVLFVGSGIPKRYFNLENWEELLKKFIAEFSKDEFKYTKYLSKVKEKDYYGKQAKIATLLEKDYNEAALEKGEFEDFRIKNLEKIKSGVSPLKIRISDYLSNLNFSNPLIPQEVRLLKQIAKRNVSGIITTNYDCFLEDIFDDYQVFSGQEELIFSTLQGIGEIYKIHGTCHNPESLILTSNDYKKFEEKSDYLIAKLLTIFVEYPIIFLGYSLEDKDIKNIFCSISKCMDRKHINLLKKQLIFVEWNKEIEEVSTRSFEFENGKQIEMTKITTDDFLSIYESINEIRPKFSPRVIRDLKKEIYKLAESSNPESILVATGFENMDKLDKSKNFVVSIGINEKYGLPVEADDIYKDIIFDNGSFSIDLLVEVYLPKLLSMNSGGLPIRKYLKNYNGIISPQIQTIISQKNSVSAFLNTQQIKQKSRYRNQLNNKNILSIIQKEGEENAYKKIYFLEENEINLSDLENYLQKIVKNKIVSLKGNSELKRLIRIYDFMKFK